MGFYLLYFVLLALWPALLWPALRLAGWRRVWLLIVAAAGLLATLHEIRMWFWTTAAIRLDILLIAVVLVCLYGSAAAILFRARWWKSAVTLSLVLVLLGGTMWLKWMLLRGESERLREVMHTRFTLLFEAKFRTRAIYDSHFGPIDADTARHPVGHWQVREEGYYRRLIINAAGDVWLFHICSAAECAFASSGRGGRKLLEAAEGGWQATVGQRVGTPVDLHIRRDGPDDLAVVAKGESLEFVKAPPPILGTAPGPESLDYLGAFAALTCIHQHAAALRQLWLWREGERLYAVGVVSTLAAGRRAEFVSPTPLGEGEPVAGGWRFAWKQGRQGWRATVSLAGPRPVLDLRGDGVPPEKIALDRPAVIRDEAVSLAPLTSKANWDRWFEIVLVGHFASGEVPAC
ncbi:MAG: hypothetical protein QF893_20485 [Alphaproteobacteria bacterium]|jgi:hypothetical protein|nr:hypothetical protein [Alphaproteobacteria bacterium]